MKKIILLLGFVSFLAASSIQWETNIPRGNEKPVVVMVEKQGCPWCKRMKSETFEDANIKASLKEFDLVRIELPRWNRMGFEQVQSVPTVFFLDKEKRVIKKVVGFWEAGDFAFDIKRVKAQLQK